MKKTLRFLSMAALVLMGATMTGCTSSELANEQPLNTAGKKVTLTTTVSYSATGTKAVDPLTGKKTFAINDYIAVVYQNTEGNTKTAYSKELEESDIKGEGKSASFTVTLEDPNPDGDVRYIYPGFLLARGAFESEPVTSDKFIDYNALQNQQCGLISVLGSSFDLSIFDGTMTSEAKLPASATLANKLAICAFTIKDNSGMNITNGLTQLTIFDGENTYTVKSLSEGRPFGEDVVYVAIKPVNAALVVTTAAGTKTMTSREYAASNGYNISLKIEGVIGGKFSVSATKQVYFSKGNLQATGTVSSDITTWTWKFAEHQWDKIGGRDQAGAGTPTGNNNINGNGKLSASGTVDLFGWSTAATHLGIHNSTDNGTYNGDFVDWGSAPEVTACIGTGWRTLSNTKSGGETGEWDYLLTKRNTTSAMRFYKAQVNGVNGLILFPDDWKDSYHPLTAGNVNNNAISFESTKITASVWNSDFEANGAVFLPVAGQRYVDNNYVEYPNGRGHYWSSTPNDAGTAYRLYFTGNSSAWSYSIGSSRRFGYAVRLVRDAN